MSISNRAQAMRAGDALAKALREALVSVNGMIPQPRGHKGEQEKIAQHAQELDNALRSVKRCRKRFETALRKID